MFNFIRNYKADKIAREILRAEVKNIKENQKQKSIYKITSKDEKKHNSAKAEKLSGSGSVLFQATDNKTNYEELDQAYVRPFFL